MTVFVLSTASFLGLKRRAIACWESRIKAVLGDDLSFKIWMISVNASIENSYGYILAGQAVIGMNQIDPCCL